MATKLALAMILVLGAVHLNACAENDTPSNLRSNWHTTESAETACVLAFVNDAGTDFATLDEQVGLDRRAVGSLMARRNGADGVLATADDGVIADLGELAQIDWMGEAALDRLTRFATTRWCAGRLDRQFEARYGEVAFTTQQAAVTLTIVNTATDAELSGIVGDAALARQIIDAREITDLRLLVDVPGVDRGVMVALRAESMRW